MAGERLTVEVNGLVHVKIAIEGDMHGDGWRGLGDGTVMPTSDWLPGDVNLVVSEPMATRAMKARASAQLESGQLVFTGLCGFRWW